MASIDLSGGQCVQWIGGRERALELGDPRPWARRFAPLGEIAVVDLDAALGQGDNAALVRELCGLARCRVGGGIRSVEAARAWLDAGAERVVLGTRAVPEVLRELPRERVMAALDACDGEVVVEGWRTRTGAGILERMRALDAHVGGFLVTSVEREGRMGGADLELARRLVEVAGPGRLTLAGGVTEEREVAELDALGVDAQVGMAIYDGRLDLARAFAAPLIARLGEGPWPTLVADERGTALGLVHSDAQSLGVALREGRGVYRSRRRGLWRKGESSGDVQELVGLALDCDRDALLVRVRQRGRGFCHTGSATCFGPARGLERLQRTLDARAAEREGGGYTRALLDDPDWLRAKLVEEAGELADARGQNAVRHEAADLLYFAGVALARAGLGWADVERELDARARRVTRRGGARKDGGDA